MSNLRAGPIWSVRLPVLNIPWNPKDSHGWTPGNPLSESLGITRNPARLGVGPRNLSFQRRPRFDVGAILKLPFDVLKFRANPQESPSGSLGITRNPARLGVGPRNLSFQRRPRFDVGAILKLPFDVLKFRANPQDSPSGSLGITRNPAKVGPECTSIECIRKCRSERFVCQKIK